MDEPGGKRMDGRPHGTTQIDTDVHVATPGITFNRVLEIVKMIRRVQANARFVVTTDRIGGPRVLYGVDAWVQRGLWDHVGQWTTGRHGVALLRGGHAQRIGLILGPRQVQDRGRDGKFHHGMKHGTIRRGHVQRIGITSKRSTRLCGDVSAVLGSSGDGGHGGMLVCRSRERKHATSLPAGWMDPHGPDSFRRDKTRTCDTSHSASSNYRLGVYSKKEDIRSLCVYTTLYTSNMYSETSYVSLVETAK